MKTIKLFLIVILLSFSLFTIYIVVTRGYMSVLEVAFSNPSAIQLYLDLVISILLINMWIIFDVRNHGKPWTVALPYIILSLFLGVIGPLVYLVLRKWDRDSQKG